jgi:hypothetical protein
MGIFSSIRQAHGGIADRGVGKKFAPALFPYQGTVFARTSKMAIGSGVLLANELMHRYCHANYTVNQLASLAIYILSKGKEGVVGCGGPQA